VVRWIHTLASASRLELCCQPSLVAAAMNTSTGALPAPAPIPVNDASTRLAPCSTATIEFATPSDRLWCAWSRFLLQAAVSGAGVDAIGDVAHGHRTAGDLQCGGGSFGELVDIAATIGTVACPPHVTILRVGASRCSSRLTTGTRNVPTEAGGEIQHPHTRIAQLGPVRVVRSVLPEPIMATGQLRCDVIAFLSGGCTDFCTRVVVGRDLQPWCRNRRYLSLIRTL
jgi:hypothetical protein